MSDSPASVSVSDASRAVVIGVDPGRAKCGLAVLAEDGTVLERGILPPDELCQRVLQWCAGRQASVVVGGSTGCRELIVRLQAAGCNVEAVDETGTSELARRRYLVDHPARGWRRLIPLGLRYPAEPYDDYAALILAERRIHRVSA